MAKKKKKDQLPPAATPTEFMCTGCGSKLKAGQVTVDDGLPVLLHPKDPKGKCPAAGKEFRAPTFQLMEI